MTIVNTVPLCYAFGRKGDTNMEDIVTQIVKLSAAYKRQHKASEKTRKKLVSLFIAARETGMSFEVIAKLTDKLYTRQNIAKRVRGHVNRVDKQ